MKINHNSIFDVEWLEQHYSDKDGVPVKYVCTSALGDENYAGDIFYRDTPHPEFGNKYFQIVNQPMTGPVIRSADGVEGLVFTMLDTPEGMYYSRHRHDFVSAGSWAIDGGRVYTRLVGDNPKIVTLKVKDGEFVTCECT